METLYRYTSEGIGIWARGKQMLPAALVEEANKNRKWLPKPDLPEGIYRFYLTKKGKEQYEKTLLTTHQKYLSNIECEEVDASELEDIVYRDEWQVVDHRSKREPKDYVFTEETIEALTDLAMLVKEIEGAQGVNPKDNG